MTQQDRTASQKQSSTDESSDPSVSLVRGGPFYRAQKAVRLIDSNHWYLGRRIVIAISVGWVPLVLLTLFSNPSAVPGLLYEYPINVRMLIAVPVLLAGQLLMENIFRRIVHHIHEASLLTPAGMNSLDQTLFTLTRWRDSSIPEFVMVIAIYLHVATMVHDRIPIALPWALAGSPDAVHLSAAGWYYALVGQLLYQLLLGISLWKWLLWTIFLFRLSKLNMQLVPTHPDKHGGIGFLGMSPAAIAPTVFAASTAIGATWRTQILRQGLHLMTFKFPAILLLAIVLIVALGPLMFFVPQLEKLRRKGILEYGILGQIHSTEFHQKWIRSRAGREEELLTAPEISTLTDFASSFENIEKLTPFPVDKGPFIVLILAIAIPLLPAVLAEIPFIEVVKGLLQAVK